MTNPNPTLLGAIQTAAGTKAARADVPPSRRGSKTFPVHLDIELWRRFKLAAFKREMSMHALIIEALEDKLNRG